MKRTEITVDAHGRTVLGFRKHKHKKYWAEERESGTIILTPAEPALVRAKISGGNPPEDVFSKILPVDEVKDRVRETPLWQERA